MVIFSSGIFINVTTTFLIVVVSTVVIYFKWSFNYWKRKGVYSPTPHFPFGNTSSFLQTIPLVEQIKNIYKECKSKNLRYGGLYFFVKPIFLLYDPELIKTILNKDFQYFSEHGSYINEEIDPLSGHLFALKGARWKNLRAKLSPTFTSSKMKMLFPTLINCSHELLVVIDKTYKDIEGINIKDIVGRFTIDVIGSCAFGIECSSLKDPNSEFTRYGKKIFESDCLHTIKHFLVNCFPKLLDILKVPFAKSDVTKFFMNIVAETVSYREINNITRNDFLHLLIQLKNNTITFEDDSDDLKQNNSEEVGNTLTMTELTAHAFSFFAAGYETSSTTLTFCFYELVHNPEIQERLRQEIKDVLKKHNEIFSYEALTKMTYLDQCIDETLRKYPPATFLTRECIATYRIPGSDAVIEKGTLMFIPILGIQSDPQHYPNPERFDPERFSPENKITRHPYTWLPFGEGPRACLGFRFALMEMKVAVAVLLRNYRFTLNSKTKTPLLVEPKSITLSVKGEVWLNAEKVTA